MGLIYVDSCILIYAFEDEGARGDAVRARMADIPGSALAISPLVAMECLTGPIRDVDPVAAYYYDEGLRSFESLPLNEAVFRRAAELRARLGLRTPDAVHLAAAQVHGCEALWTNDSRLTSVSHGLAVSLLE